MTDQQSEQDQNLTGVLGFDPNETSDQYPQSVANEKGNIGRRSEIPKEVQDAFGRKFGDLYDGEEKTTGHLQEYINRSQLLWVNKRNYLDEGVRVYHTWSRSNEGEIVFNRAISVHIGNGGQTIDVSWPLEDGSNVDVDESDRATSIRLEKDTVIVDIDLGEEVDGIFIRWDQNGNLVGNTNNILFHGQEYEIPRHIDRERIKSERFHPDLLKDPFSAPPEYDQFWKAANPLDFLGIKPKA